MDWQEALFALAGFVGGLLTALLKSFVPPYSDLFQENLALRARVAELEENLRDTLDDGLVRDPRLP